MFRIFSAVTKQSLNYFAMDQTISFNGTTIPTFPYSNTNLTGANTLKDPYGNGYYIPNSDNLMVDRQTQTSVQINNANTTTGNWSKAYMNHGILPSNQYYEYAILVQTSDVDLANFITTVSYQVL